jgi:hypothetical protein
MVVASLYHFWWLSRAVASFAIIFALALFRFGQKPPTAILITIGLVSIWLSNAMIEARGWYDPGIKSALSAIFLSKPETVAARYDDLLLNPIDASATFSFVAMLKESISLSTEHVLESFAGAISPIPSFVIEPRLILPGLNEFLGWADVGIPRPAFSELFFLFGFAGVLFVPALMIALMRLERAALSLPWTFRVVVYILSVASIVVGLHNGLRSMTRPMWYALVLILVGLYVSKHAHQARPKVITPRQRPFRS